MTLILRWGDFMKILVALAIASALATAGAVAEPFAQPQSTVATQMTYKSIKYTIDAGKTVTGIAIPVADRPIHMMVVCTMPLDRGIGSVTLMRVNGTFLEWVGTDIATNSDGTAEVEAGFSHTEGARIMFADINRSVEVEVQNDASIQIENKSSSTAKVVVTLMY